MLAPNLRVRVFLLGLLLLVAGLMIGCGEAEPTPTAVALATAVPPTATATHTPPPTATPTDVPTETPSPTPTETPTETPSPTATATATATHTPTPTPSNTPEPTETPTPVNTPTNTPIPPTLTPAVPPSPSPAPTVETVTVYYISNPNDILGVFPVRPFDAAALKNNMNRMRQSLLTMQGNIDGARNGDATACNNYVAAYDSIRFSGVFYEDVPGDWQNIDTVYFISFIYSLDRTRPAYLSCKDAGTVDQFNYGLAVQTLNETLAFLTPAINEAAGK